MNTYCNFIVSDRTSAICATAYMSYEAMLKADFRGENQNVESLFRQKPGLGGIAAYPTSVSQLFDKYLCFLGTRVSEKIVVDSENVVIALTRL